MVRGHWLICIAATGCSSILGLHDPPDQADAAGGGDDAAQLPDADVPSGCGLNTTINDPGFVAPTAWTVTGTASIDPTAAGDMDPGVAKVDGQDGAVSQSVCVAAPPSDRGLALIASVSFPGGKPQDRVQTAVGSELRYERSWTSGFTTWTQCLGEITYDRQVTAQLSGMVRFGSVIQFDKLRIAQVSSVTCPAVNTVRGGDFENTAAWNNSVYIEGTAGARQVHLRTGSASPYTCNSAAVYGDGIVSVPKVLPHAALEFKVSGSMPGNSTFSVGLVSGNNSVTALSLSSLPSAAQIYTACIPSTMLGHVLGVSIQIYQIPADPCPTAMQAYIDDLTLTTSTLCP